MKLPTLAGTSLRELCKSMGLLKSLRNKYERCIVSRVEKKGCQLTLEGMDKNQIAIIDNDVCKDFFASSGERFCDYLLFYRPKDIVAAAIELKSGTVDAGVVVEQIQNGARKIDELSHGYEVINLIPLLLYGRGVGTADVKRFRKGEYKILFRGRKSPIITRRCGSPFRQILEEF